LAAAPPAQEALDLQDILFLIENNTPEEEVLAIVKKQRIRFRLDEAAEQQLQRKGVSDRVLAVLRHLQLLDDVIAMKMAGKEELEIIRMIADRGLVLELDGSEKLLLHKKGVSKDVLHALMGNFTFREFKTHEHPGGFFRVQLPEGWKPLEEYEDDKTLVSFAPRERASGRRVTFGFRIEFAVSGKKSPHAYMALETVNQLRMRMIEVEARETGQHFRSTGEPRKSKILGVPAIVNDYEHQVGEVQVRRHAMLLYYNGVEYWLACDAPLAIFEAQRSVFEKVLLTFNPAPTELGRQIRKPSADPQHLLERYRESVVQVEALCTEGGAVVDGGAGTGWFIRRDGYVLTNHHVVHSRRLNRFADRILLKWDASLRREAVEAKLIDAVRLDNPKVDIALLKAKGASYLPMPVTRVNPANKYVKEQDKVLALGYPGIVEDGKVVPLTLTSTRGTLSKFNLRPDYKVETVIIDAVLQHGNSGGPCLDLETHSVIGLNTFFPSQGTEMTESYGGVIPVDAAFEHFPEIVCYPESVDRILGAEDFLALASQFHTQGLANPALRQVGRAFAKKMNVAMTGSLGEAIDLIFTALEKKPNFPHAFALAGDLLGVPRDSRRCYETALELDPQNLRARMGLASIDPDLAIECYSEVIRIRPKDHRAYAARARALLRAKRLAEALADARKACECCGELYAEPYCVLGRVLYEQKKFEEGLEQYRTAVRIEPRNVSARFGLVHYHYDQAQYEKTLQQIQAMAAEGARDLEWMRTSGDYCWDIAFRFEKAGDEEKTAACFEASYGFYGKAVALLEEWNQTPDKTTLLRYAWYAREHKRDTNAALRWFITLTQTLIEFRGGKRVNDSDLGLVYLNLGLLFRGLDREALAGGFFQATINLRTGTPAAQQAKQLLGSKRVPLTLDDVRLVLTKTNLSHTTAADLVMASPLAFQLSPQDAQVLRSQGWPAVVVEALLKGGQQNASQARGRDEIYKEWMEQDKTLVQNSRRIPYDKRNEEFEKYYRAHDRKDYKASIPGFKMIFYRFAKDDPPLAATAAYNICCGYSLTGETDSSLDWFELGFYWGFFNDERDMVAHCMKDADLENIRGEVRFQKVIEAAKKIKKRSASEERTNGGSLGAKLQEMAAQDRVDRGLPENVGVLIASVAKEGPAEKTGIRAGDVLCKLDEELVGDVRKATAWIRARSPGAEVTVVIFRDAEYYRAKIKLGSE